MIKINTSATPEWECDGYGYGRPALCFPVLQLGDMVSIKIKIVNFYGDYEINLYAGNTIIEIATTKSYEHALLIADYEMRKLAGEASILDTQPKDCLLYSEPTDGQY